jgi:CBS domain-containing protein
MQVREVMTPDVVFVTPESSLAMVAQRMRMLDVGALPVCDDEESRKVIGMITDRDIAIRGVADAKDPNGPVRDVMSTEAFMCGADTTVDQCVAVMEEHQVRRIPVADSEGRLVGIVALGDLAERPETQQLALEALERISASPQTKRHGRVMETAFSLWEQDGRPEGKDVEYWTKAEALWHQERQEHAQAA